MVIKTVMCDMQYCIILLPITDDYCTPIVIINHDIIFHHYGDTCGAKGTELQHSIVANIFKH